MFRKNISSIIIMYKIIIILVIAIFILCNNSSQNEIKENFAITDKEATSQISMAAADLSSSGTLQAASTININGKVISNGTEIIPIGYIMAFAGRIIPNGWRICDGTGGTPDLRGRCIIGAGQGIDLTNRGLNQPYGAATHTLSAAEIVSHTHTTNPANPATHTHKHNRTEGGGGPGTGGGGTRNASGENTSSVSHTHYVQNSGGGQAHNNMQPYLVLNYIMRVS